MRSKFHYIWITSDEQSRLVVAFAGSDDKMGKTPSRYYRPGEKSAARLRDILNNSKESPFLVLHADGPSVTYYVSRTRKPAPAPRPALALAA